MSEIVEGTSEVSGIVRLLKHLDCCLQHHLCFLHTGFLFYIAGIQEQVVPIGPAGSAQEWFAFLSQLCYHFEEWPRLPTSPLSYCFSSQGYPLLKSLGLQRSHLEGMVEILHPCVKLLLWNLREPFAQPVYKSTFHLPFLQARSDTSLFLCLLSFDLLAQVVYQDVVQLFFGVTERLADVLQSYTPCERMKGG